MIVSRSGRPIMSALLASLVYIASAVQRAAKIDSDIDVRTLRVQQLRVDWNTDRRPERDGSTSTSGPGVCRAEGDDRRQRRLLHDRLHRRSARRLLNVLGWCR